MRQKFISLMDIIGVSTGLKIVLQIFLVLSLAGCQFIPMQQDTAPQSTVSQSATPHDEEMIEGQAAVEEQPLAQPNPYLTNRPRVSSEAIQRFESAKQALSEQQWELAETDLLWLTENHANLSGPHLTLALLYKTTDQPEQSESAFKQAITANADNVEAYDQYGIFLREQGQFKQAETIYLQALQKWQDSPNTHRNLGILYDLYLGDFTKALHHYRRYQELLGEPDRQVAGWIIDTERRISNTLAGDGL